MPASATRHRLALAIALAGVTVSAVTLLVHHKLAADSGYTSFCNLGGVVNCDAVLGSRYGTLFGVSVAAWGLAAFAAGAVLAVPGAVVGSAVGLADLLLLGLVSASVGFSLVMAFLSLVVLRHLCLLCLATYLVVAAWAVAVAPLAARFDAGAAAGWWRRRTAARAFAAAAAILAVGGATWAAVRAPAGALTVADVRARDPKFYGWYTQLPVRPPAELTDDRCHHKGPADAAVAIVEFSDFQCPFCVQAARDLRDLMRGRNDVSLVFRHFPLDTTCNERVTRTLHANACLAACAAECAGRQGRFWEYHDALFDNHERLERDDLFRYAREIPLDIAAFRACLDDPTTRARIDADIEAATRAGVTSTPTLFINGRAVKGALERPYYDYALVIENHARHAPGGAS